MRQNVLAEGYGEGSNGAKLFNSWHPDREMERKQGQGISFHNMLSNLLVPAMFLLPINFIKL